MTDNMTTNDQNYNAPSPNPSHEGMGINNIGFPHTSGEGKGGGNWVQRYQTPVWLSLIALAVAVAGVLTYLLFFRTTEKPQEFQGDAKLTIDAPASIPSGSEISYRIRVENLSNTTLTGLSLELLYPQEFELIDTTPDPGESAARRFDLSDLQSGKDTTVVVVGRLQGGLQELKTLNAKLYYIPQNFRSTFVAEAKGVTEIEASALTVRLNSPAQLVTGQNITYELAVTNVSDESFSDLTAHFIFPEKFVLPQDAKADIPLPPLAVSQTRSVRVAGKLMADPGTDSLVEVELRRPNQAGESVTVGRAYAFTKVQPSPLAISHGLVTPRTEIVIPDRLEYQVRYENQSDTGLNNVAIAVVFETPVFSHLQIDTETGQKKGSSFLWIPAANKELSVVSPGEKGTFNFTVDIPESLGSQLLKNPLIATHVEYTADELPSAISGNSLSYKIDTGLAVVAAASDLGGGRYLVQFVLRNTVNDITGGELVATIPGASSSFDPGSVLPPEEKSRLEFNPASGILRWRFGEIFAFSGSFSNCPALYVAIK